MMARTVQFEDVLRLFVIEFAAFGVSHRPQAIGVQGQAVIGERGIPGPIELVLTPIQAANLLDRLAQLRRDGHIPPEIPLPPMAPLRRQ